MRARFLVLLGLVTTAAWLGVASRPVAADDKPVPQPAPSTLPALPDQTAEPGLTGQPGIGGQPAAASPPYVQRGTVTRQGRAWVEEITCGAPVREGGRLVLRTDLGSVAVKPGASDRMECRVRLEAFVSDEAEARRYLSGYELNVRLLEAGSVHLRGESTRTPAWTPKARPKFKPIAQSAPPAPEAKAARPAPPAPPVPLNVQFEILVPVRFHLDLETSGGGIAVARLEGELRAATAAGDIRTGDIGGPVRVETAGGCILLHNIGERVEARTAGGSIRVGDVKGAAVLETVGGEIVGGRIAGAVRAATAGGDIVLASAGADIVAETAGGQIRIGEAGGSVSAETAGGSIRLEAARGPIRVQTAGGSIDLYRVQSAVEAITAAGRIRALIAASRESFRRSLLETSFGDVEVYLPPDLPLTIEATIEMAAGHKILTDFPLEIEDEEPGYGRASVEGRGHLNGGGQVLRIRTVAGNIEIRRLDPQARQRLEDRHRLLKEREWKREEQRRQREEERRQQREKDREKD